MAIEAMRFGSETMAFHAAARVNDVGIAFKDAVAQMVLAQELPDILGGVQLRGIGWQVK